MTEAILIREDRGNIAHLTLNAPASLNALSDAMLARLQDTLDAIAAERAISVVVLSGAGKAFCAGHDLKEMTAARAAPDGGAARFADLFGRCARLMKTLRDLPQPVIAQVHGIATAAGCQLVASCDLAVAADTARFGVNGVNIGLFCSTPMVALSRNVPRKQAFEMLTTGRFLDAGEAARIGLINRAVPEADLAAATGDLATTIAAKLGPAVRRGKRAFYRQAEMPLDAAYDFTQAEMVANMLEAETAEGVAAFLEKRPPAWSR